MRSLFLLFCLFSSLQAALPFEACLENSHQKPSSALLNILQEFSIEHDGSWESIIEETQKKWLRKAGTERWETSEGETISPKQYELFRQVCMTEVSFADQKHYDYAVILGATLEKVRSRFHFLKKEWNKGVRFDKLVILTGDRPLNPEFENQESLCQSSFPIREGWTCPKSLPKNETQMCLFVYDQLDLPEEMRKKELILIDAPQKNGVRPNTKDTFEEWLKQKPLAGSLLLVSDQPFLSRADLLAHKMLVSFDIDTVGEGISLEACQKQKRATSILLDELARILYTFNTISEK